MEEQEAAAEWSETQFNFVSWFKQVDSVCVSSPVGSSFQF